MCIDCLYGVFNVCVVFRMWGEDFIMYYCFYGYDNFLGIYIGEIII